MLAIFITIRLSYNVSNFKNMGMVTNRPYQIYDISPLGTKKSWTDGGLFEDWVRQKQNTYGYQN